MKNRTKLVEKIEAVDAELKNVDRYQDFDKWWDLENKKINLKNELTDVDLLQSIYDLTEENSMRKFLCSNTQTVQLMSAFKNSGKQFLVFKAIFMLETKSGYCSVSLVVTHGEGSTGVVDELTITDLKTMGMGLNNHLFSLNQEHPEGRKYLLLSEMEKIAKRGIGNKKNIPFSKPCPLRAQTYENLEGFGNRYYGRELVEEGTKYGETTSFAIIGITLP